MITVCIVRTRTQSVFSLVSRYTHSVLGEMNVTDRNENNKISTIDCMGVGIWGIAAFYAYDKNCQKSKKSKDMICKLNAVSYISRWWWQRWILKRATCRFLQLLYISWKTWRLFITMGEIDDQTLITTERDGSPHKFDAKMTTVSHVYN